MEVQLLNLVLALRVTRPSLPHRVHEEQLRRNIRYLVRGIRLKRQIPNRQLLVARHGENGRVVRRPLHRSDRRAQVVEVAHTASTAPHLAHPRLLQIANIPDAERAVVAARHHEVAHLPDAHTPSQHSLVPVDHVHVAVVRVHGQHALPRGVARVPELDGAIHAARREHRRLRRAPLQVLHRRAVRHERLRVRLPARLGGQRHVDRRGAVARHQLALVAPTPVQRVTLAAVALELEERRAGALLVSGGVPALESRQLRSDVVDADDALIGPDTHDLGAVGKALEVTRAEDTNADAIHGSVVRNGVVHDARLLVVVVRLRLFGVVIVLRLAQTEHLAHHNVVVDDVLGLGSGNRVQRVGILQVTEGGGTNSLASNAQIVGDDIEAQTRPVHVQTVVHAVGAVVVLHALSLLHLVLADFEYLPLTPLAKYEHRVFHFPPRLLPALLLYPRPPPSRQQYLPPRIGQ